MGSDPQVTNGRQLLALVPEDAVSVFCVDVPIKLRPWDDLSELTAFQTAVCLATMLGQRDPRLSLGVAEVQCVVSAIKDIRLPKPRPASPVLNGPFTSKRCEFFLLGGPLPPDHLISFANANSLPVVQVLSQNAVEVSLGAAKFLVGQLPHNIVCVANDVEMFSDVLRLAYPDGGEKKSIEANSVFQTGVSSVAPNSPFWGVRLFRSLDASEDPTSFHNTHRLCGIHDPGALFAALYVSKPESSEVHLLYASADALSASKLFPEYLGKSVALTRAPVQAGRGGDDMRRYTLAASTVDLKSVVVPGMDKPSVIMLGICAMLGQGFLL